MPPDSELSDEILTWALPTEDDYFAELSSSVHWEDVGKGRRGAVLARIDEAGVVPLVRTTTRYARPAQRFRSVHERLAREVHRRAKFPVAFNNALIESYTNAYKDMGAHSDQALDLADGSFIAVFSCYEHPVASPPRKLVFKPKTSDGAEFEVPLAHNGVVAFSVDTNRRLRHRIVLNRAARAMDNRWLGVTFRTSKTLVRFDDGGAYLPEGERLTLADEEQRNEFYQLRRRENRETDFVYPRLTCTISESDLLPPV